MRRLRDKTLNEIAVHLTSRNAQPVSPACRERWARYLDSLDRQLEQASNATKGKKQPA